jgi:hypothetical protein
MARSRRSQLLPLLLLCAVPSVAQTTFLVRITELRSSKYTCKVIADNGKLRREVMSVATGQSHPEIFEGVASEHDLERIKSLIADPDFQTASRQNKPGLTMVSPEGRIISVEATLGNGHQQTVAFDDPYGKTSTPGYLTGFLTFAEEVKDRKLPKVKGNVGPMCMPLSHH